MTAKELAQKLDGREYGSELTIEEKKEAKAAGLVVVYGASDDLVEFEGAIHDEAGAFEPATIYLSKAGIFRVPDDSCREAHNCPYYEAATAACKKINASYGGYWAFETDIPCERFNIYDEGEFFCEGLVFSIDDL